MECKDYILAQKTAIDALRFDPKDSELNMYAILAMGFQGNLSMAQTYYTAAKPYLALEHAEVIKKYLNIKWEQLEVVPEVAAEVVAEVTQ